MLRESVGDDKRVREFRQILLWPLQLLPLNTASQIQRHWEVLEAGGADCPWHEVLDEFTGDPTRFQERHYNEFVTFLPYVQRFLYGEGRSRNEDRHGASCPGRWKRRPRKWNAVEGGAALAASGGDAKE